MLLVLVERNGLDHLRWAWVHCDIDAELVEGAHRGRIERGHRSRFEGDVAVVAVCGSQLEHVVAQIELDLETALVRGHERRREPRADT